MHAALAAAEKNPAGHGVAATDPQGQKEPAGHAMGTPEAQ